MNSVISRAEEKANPPKWRHPVLLVNAGSRHGQSQMEQAETLLKKHGIPLAAVERVDGSRLIDHLHAHVDAGADLVIVGGGDGTLRLAAEALRDTEVVLGALPLGTGNNFARDLGIPVKLEDACRILGEGRMEEVDLGEIRFGDGKRHIFINAAHVGIFGEVNPSITETLKRRYGYLAYAIGARDVVKNFEPFQLCATVGRRTQCWTIVQMTVVLGQVYSGGVGEIPGETLDDSRMTLSILEKDKPVNLFTTILRMARSRQASPLRAHRIWTSEAYVETEGAQDVNVDGEVMGQTPFTVRVLPKAIRALCGDLEHPVVEVHRKHHRAAAGLLLGAAAGMTYYYWRSRTQNAMGDAED